jgi:ABC-2 type transport system ATP-binding protein
MSEPAIIVDSVSKNFRLYHERNRYIKAAILRGRRARYEEFWALENVSFEVEHGSTLGLIGSNGSGKSTMLKCLTGIYRPDKGRIAVNGNIAALLELGSGFHPELSGRENIYLNAVFLRKMLKGNLTALWNLLVLKDSLTLLSRTTHRECKSGSASQLRRTSSQKSCLLTKSSLLEIKHSNEKVVRKLSNFVAKEERLLL